MALHSKLLTYLRHYQLDMALVNTDWQRGQVQRLYRHEAWMGNWQAYWCSTSRIAYAVRVHRDTRELQWAFAASTSGDIQAFIKANHAPH